MTWVAVHFLRRDRHEDIQGQLVGDRVVARPERNPTPLDIGVGRRRANQTIDLGNQQARLAALALPQRFEERRAVDDVVVGSALDFSEDVDELAPDGLDVPVQVGPPRLQAEPACLLPGGRDTNQANESLTHGKGSDRGVVHYLGGYNYSSGGYSTPNTFGGYNYYGR